MMEFRTASERWYALAVKAGNENSTKRRILERLEKDGKTIPGLEIICPEQEITVQNKKGANQRKRKMSMPGYMLIRCRKLDEDSINLITRVKGVMQFMGGNDHPTDLPLIEVRKILNDTPTGQTEDSAGIKAPTYEIGETVEVTDGALQGFEAVITEYNGENGTAAVDVEIFGRTTKAQLKTSQIKKL